ncbi:MAG: C4-type zinc ribbon domain-containing protein [Eubacteriales bacterium]
MEKLEKLFQYQTIDQKLEEINEKLKNTATRTRLQKIHDYLQKQQEAIKKLEQSLIVKQNDVDDAGEQLKKLKKEFGLLAKEIEEAVNDELDTVELPYIKTLVQDQEKVYEQLSKQKKRLESVISSSEGVDDKLKTVLVNVTKAKKEFADLKKKHDVEIKESEPEIEKLKKQLAAAEKKVDTALIKRYKKIKSSISSPIVLVTGDTCPGCNMNIPSSQMTKIKQGEILECESCGRIIYIKES